jgi:hypothetical protein
MVKNMRGSQFGPLYSSSFSSRRTFLAKAATFLIIKSVINLPVGSLNIL